MPATLAPRRHRRRISALIRPHTVALLSTLLLALAVAGANVVEPLVLRAFFDGLDRDALSDLTQRSGALAAVGGLIALVLFREAATGVSNWLTWRTRLGVHHHLLEATVGRLQTLPIAYHQRESVGGLMTKLDRGIQGLLGALSELAFGVLPALVYLVLSVVVMAELDHRLLVVVMAFTPLPAIFGALAAPEQARRERDLLDRWVAIYSRFHEVLSGILVVKSFQMEEVEKHRFLSGVSEANGVVARGVARDSWTAAAKGLSVDVARLAAIGAGGYLLVRGDITIGTVIAFLGYVGGLFGPVQTLTGAYQTMKKAVVSLETLGEILDAEDDLADAPNAIRLKEPRGHVVVDEVFFRYGEGPFVLQGVSLEAKRGEVVAIVGPSGGGKSTLMALLQRLHDPTGGAITLDGLDLRDLEQKSLKGHIGVVLQEPLLFNDTVRSNIAYGCRSASEAAIVAAAKAANADGFIRDLDGGYDAIVGERGGRLSVGQRQRIAIARALLKDPRVLILDEATSALDAESEAEVQAAIQHLARGRTTFVIAHRLSTVVGADRIYVLAGGQIVEVGSHAELVRRNGYYASLVERQLGGLLAAA